MKNKNGTKVAIIQMRKICIFIQQEKVRIQHEEKISPFSSGFKRP